MSNVLITPDDMERISRQMEISQQTLDSLYATCKRSLHILPLRFSAIYAEAEDAAALAAVPEFEGGLGTFISRGISQSDPRQLIVGAVAVSLLAIIVDYGLLAVQKRFTPKGMEGAANAA